MHKNHIAMDFVPFTATWHLVVVSSRFRFRPFPTSLTRSIELHWFHLTGSPRDRSTVNGLPMFLDHPRLGVHVAISGQTGISGLVI